METLPRFFLVVSLLCGLIYTIAKTSQTTRQQNAALLKVLVPPPQQIHRLAFGFNEVLSDSLWLSLLQNFDHCNSKDADEKVCPTKGWFFKVVESVMNLSPKFRKAHFVGPLALSVVVKDIPGASIAYDRAVDAFPSDWPILYGAAYQAIFEENNFEKGAQLVKRVAENGGPEWIYGLAAHLYTKAGQRQFAEAMLKDLEENQRVSEDTLERVRKNIHRKLEQSP